MRKSKGFTLIELMIVVAIIGILAAIAIPNFLKFQCKSKQSEAKTNLAGLFTAEKAFFGEYNTYSTDLISVNWQPDGTPLYVYGFNAAYPGASTLQEIASYNENRNNTSLALVANIAAGTPRYSTNKMVDLNGAAYAPATDLPSTFLDGQSFVAGAAGDVDTDKGIAKPSSLDQQSIDNVKRVVSVQNDCTS